tara:strand:+ start:497 stop:691 length:195 start_codon:yes stop_codon:yes gene_type:complete
MIEEFSLKNIFFKQNSQRSAIVMLLILNLFQLRELGLIHIKIKEMAHLLLLVEREIECHRDFQK